MSNISQISNPSRQSSPTFSHPKLDKILIDKNPKVPEKQTKVDLFSIFQIKETVSRTVWILWATSWMQLNFSPMRCPRPCTPLLKKVLRSSWGPLDFFLGKSSERNFLTELSAPKLLTLWKLSNLTAIHISQKHYVATETKIHASTVQFAND